MQVKNKLSRLTLILALGFFVSIAVNSASFVNFKNIFARNTNIESPVAEKRYEVFGFAPYWTINKLDNIDWSVLTTLAYFGVPVNGDGTLDEENIGYTTLDSSRAQQVFDEAQSNGSRVVLTITQMNNDDIEQLLSDETAQRRSINNTIQLVKRKNLDGVNIDYEYVGLATGEQRRQFAKYVEDFTNKLHQSVPNSKLTVSVYAGSLLDNKLYDIEKIAKSSDAIFMMAYDFATTSSDHVIPTAPLYGHKEGKYWYDISTAVEDFLKVMPSDKLILGLPWYGYDYPVEQPGVKVAKYPGYYYTYYYKRRKYTAYQSLPSSAVTYATATKNIQMEQTGWDDIGKVGWKAYKEDGVWRMMFLDDPKSLKLKYDFAKDKRLAGVGIWALGFDAGTDEMWRLLAQEFGTNLAYNTNN